MGIAPGAVRIAHTLAEGIDTAAHPLEWFPQEADTPAHRADSMVLDRAAVAAGNRVAAEVDNRIAGKAVPDSLHCGYLRSTRLV